MRLALLLLAALLAIAPMGVAHDPVGTPKNYCEDPSEWDVHDYAPVSVRVFNFLGWDGNVVGDCDGDGLGYDFDGHYEWASGGAMLLAESGDGVTGGASACYVTTADHPVFGPFTVTDAVLGSGVSFLVGADTVNLVPPTSGPDCGDGILDATSTCIGTCTVTFTPGLDGAYFVNVGSLAFPGTAGHVCTSGCGGGGSPPPECVDGHDNDGGGGRDWINPGGRPDMGCGLPTSDEDSTSNELTPYTGPCADFVDNDGDGERDWADLIGLVHGTGDADQCTDPLDPSEA
jgi:hypothetical protein